MNPSASPRRSPKERTTSLDPQLIQTWARAYLQQAPISLCLREIHRLVAIEHLDAGRKATPVLDVGCGDGFWWTLRDTVGRDVYGIDIAEGEVAQAQKHIRAEVFDVTKGRPFPNVSFEQIVGNCSLEHVPDIDTALGNLHSAAAPNGELILFVPTPQWAFQGRMQSALLKRAPRFAMAASGAINGFFQHWHLYDESVWRRLLESNGWRVVHSVGLGNARAEFLFRLFLPPAFAQFAVKSAIDVYPSHLTRYLPDFVVKRMCNLIAQSVADPFVPIDSPKAYEYAIVAERAD